MNDWRIRSLLMTPATSMALAAKAAASPADAVWLDLEDGAGDISPDVTRDVVCGALLDLDWSNKRTLVRVNQITTPVGRADIEAVKSCEVDGIVLPKVESAQEIALLKGTIKGSPAGDRATTWCMIESIGALSRLAEIAAACGPGGGLIFGAGELLSDLGGRRLPQDPQFDALAPARFQTVVAARAYGLHAIDGSHPVIADIEGTKRSADRTFAQGFDGKLVASPRQIEAIHEAFGPSESELAEARGTLAWLAEGSTTVELRGGRAQVPGPAAKRAADVLRRARLAGITQHDEV